MKLFLQGLIMVTSLAVLSCAPTPTGDPVLPTSDHKSLLNYQSLEHAREMIETGDSLYLIPFRLLQAQVRKIEGIKPPSVMDKQHLPPSGDKHDYTSLGPYWWPNPDSEDGLPYIRKDGVVNPQRDQYDKIPGATMTECAKAYVLMYYFTGDEKYAARAAEFLKVWFIRPETRMNPNLNFGQFIPGRSAGRSVGIIESRNFVFLTEYEPLLAASPHWTENDHGEFKAWMAEFLNWLVTSDMGRQEREHANNHGSWCDFQLLALSQYCDQLEVGLSVAASIQKNRLAKQIDKSGMQPEELSRTKSFNYSIFNLEALTNIAILAENYGFDLSQHNGKPSEIKLAIDYLLPFVTGVKDWEHTQITGKGEATEKMIFIINYARLKWSDSNYNNALKLLGMKYPETRYILTTSAFDGLN